MRAIVRLLIGSAILALAALAFGRMPTFASTPDADLDRFTKKKSAWELTR